jgi:hypothetical protein
MFNTYIWLDSGTFTKGRYIGGVLDKSAPTCGRIILFNNIIQIALYQLWRDFNRNKSHSYHLEGIFYH